MNRLKVQLGLTGDEIMQIRELLVRGNENYSGQEIWERLNEFGFMIVPVAWLKVMGIPLVVDHNPLSDTDMVEYGPASKNSSDPGHGV